MFKVKYNCGPKLLNYIFIRRVYNGPALRSVSDFEMPLINSVHFGDDSLRSFGNIILNIVPGDFKNYRDYNSFKRRIINWAPENCPCRLCKRFIQGVGYI